MKEQQISLIGPSSEARSPNVDLQSTVNWYIEQNQGGRGSPVMYSFPGIEEAFDINAQLGIDEDIREMHYFDGNLWLFTDNFVVQVDTSSNDPSQWTASKIDTSFITIPDVPNIKATDNGVELLTNTGIIIGDEAGCLFEADSSFPVSKDDLVRDFSWSRTGTNKCKYSYSNSNLSLSTKLGADLSFYMYFPPHYGLYSGKQAIQNSNAVSKYSFFAPGGWFGGEIASTDTEFIYDVYSVDEVDGSINFYKRINKDVSSYNQVWHNSLTMLAAEEDGNGYAILFRFGDGYCGEFKAMPITDFDFTTDWSSNPGNTVVSLGCDDSEDDISERNMEAFYLYNGNFYYEYQGRLYVKPVTTDVATDNVNVADGNNAVLGYHAKWVSYNAEDGYFYIYDGDDDVLRYYSTSDITTLADFNEEGVVNYNKTVSISNTEVQEGDSTLRYIYSIKQGFIGAIFDYSGYLYHACGDRIDTFCDGPIDIVSTPEEDTYRVQYSFDDSGVLLDFYLNGSNIYSRRPSFSEYTSSSGGDGVLLACKYLYDSDDDTTYLYVEEDGDISVRHTTSTRPTTLQNGLSIKVGNSESPGVLNPDDSSLSRLKLLPGPVEYTGSTISSLDLSTYDPSGFVQVVDDDNFPSSPGDLVFLDGYFIIGDRQETGRFRASALYDASRWPEFSFATAERSPDSLESIEVNGRELWLIGSETAEVWQNVGGDIFPFAPTQQGFLESGIGDYARYSAVAEAGTVFFLGRNKAGEPIVYAANGLTPQIISNRNIENSLFDIADSINVDQNIEAIAMVFQYRGHLFYVLTAVNPTGTEKKGTTFLYDVSNEQWTELTSPSSDRWAYDQHEFVNGWHLLASSDIVNDSEDSLNTRGKVFYITETTVQDRGEAVERVRTSPYIYEGNTPLFHHSVEIEAEAITEDPEADPCMYLRWSDDQGNTWSSWKERSLRKQSNGKLRSVWRKLGRSRNRVYQFKTDCPLSATVINAWANIKGDVQ